MYVTSSHNRIYRFNYFPEHNFCAIQGIECVSIQIKLKSGGILTDS